MPELLIGDRKYRFIKRHYANNDATLGVALPIAPGFGSIGALFPATPAMTLAPTSAVRIVHASASIGEDGTAPFGSIILNSAKLMVFAQPSAVGSAVIRLNQKSAAPCAVPLGSGNAGIVINLDDFSFASQDGLAANASPFISWYLDLVAAANNTSLVAGGLLVFFEIIWEDYQEIRSLRAN
jgi:hypothetical protein